MPEVLTLHAQAYDEATPTRRTPAAALPRAGTSRPPRHRIALVRHALFGCCLLAAACEPEVGGKTSWSVTFACAAHAAQSETVKVAISPEPCASPSTPVYRATIRREDANGMAAPPSLTGGTYAFSATAFDSSGEAITTICRDVGLPREHAVTLVLPGPQGCEPARPPDGIDAGDPYDENPFDDGPDGVDAAIAPSDGGVPTVDASAMMIDASAPMTDAGAPPEPNPDGGPCGGPCETTVYSSPTQDISLPKQCWAPGEFMPVTIHIPVIAKDWLWVKNHPDYGGNDREFWDNTGITTAGAVYRGGERQPSGLHAPTTTGSFSITWHPNDAGDKDVKSTLGFTVSNDCP